VAQVQVQNKMQGHQPPAEAVSRGVFINKAARTSW
jgi:hypothetical protein